MNEVFIKVYLAKKVPLGIFGPYGLDWREPLSLDEILIGDPVKRERNRQEYMNKKLKNLKNPERAD
jgi:hypothetical protein